MSEAIAAEKAVGASPFEALGASVEHIKKMLDPVSIAGNSAHPVKMGLDEIAISTYMVYFLIALTLTVVVVFAARKRMALVPKGRFVNGFEALFDFVRNNIVASAIHHDRARYVPFLATTFLFILVNNLIGLIPGAKAGVSGTIGGTLALSLVVFVYFSYQGIRVKGGLGYIKGLVPSGLPKAVVPLIFVIEFASVLLRPVTQSLRLFANMYAGHIVLGIFAVLTELFFMAPFHGGGILNVVAAPVWLVLLIAMYALEFVVALIQAYVFTLLTAVYIESATSKH